MTKIGTPERPLRVAIVGSGPSGFYAAEGLFKSDLSVTVDIFDKLPTPFGLLRGGVAPDHQKMKSVSKAYHRIAQKEGFSFFGNVTIGKDVKLDTLRKYYDAIVMAYGAETDRALGIPGEDLSGSHTATAFVGWYNGHPDYQACQFDLSVKSVAIIGQGNVAIDVARILAKTPTELAKSDISQIALDTLAKSNIEDIYLIGRRGPVQAAFTELEIKEMGMLSDAEPILDESYLTLSETDKLELALPQRNKARKNMIVLKAFSQQTRSDKKKRLHICFFRSPKSIDGFKKVESLLLSKTKLCGEPGAQWAEDSGYTQRLEVDLVFRSIGYKGRPLEELPFDTKKGRFQHQEGRVVAGDTVVKGLYASGWIKRGATGVIGTNRADSFETIKSLIEDVPHLYPCKIPSTEAMKSYLKDNKVRVVSYQDWEKIDALELQRGAEKGKPREKFTNIKDMLASLDE